MIHAPTDIPDPYGARAKRNGAIIAVIIAALAWILGTCGLLRDLDKPGQSPEDREQIERNWTP